MLLRDLFLITNSTYLTKFSRDILTPALPALVLMYALTPTQSQYTLSIYFFGIMIARLIWPYFADRENRPQLQVFLHGLFLIGTAFCFVSNQYFLLLIGRFMQALSIASIPLLTRARIIETYGKEKTVKIYGYVGILSTWAPAIAATLGAYLLKYFGIQSIFAVLFLIGFINLFAIFYTLRRERHVTIIPENQDGIFKSYLNIFKNLSFWKLALPFSLLISGNAFYLSTSSFLIIEGHGFTPELYAISYFVLMSGTMIGKLVSGKLIDTKPMTHIVLAASTIAFLSGLCGLYFSRQTHFNPWYLINMVTLYYFAIGMSASTSKSLVATIAKGNLTTLLGAITLIEAAASFLMSLLSAHLTPGWNQAFLVLTCLGGTSMILFIFNLNNIEKN